MAEPVLEGASLPEGFEVDETSAYFGVTESSDIVHQLMSMDKNQSIVAFFTMVSDVVLKPGEFDFEEAEQGSKLRRWRNLLSSFGAFGIDEFR